MAEFVTNADPWSWFPRIPKFNLAMVVIVPDSIGLPSITSNYLDSFNSCSFNWWWWTKSLSMNAIPVARQSIKARDRNRFGFPGCRMGLYRTWSTGPGVYPHWTRPRHNFPVHAWTCPITLLGYIWISASFWSATIIWYFMSQLSIWVLIVSQYDLCVNDAVYGALSPRGLRFAIQ
jgi:hypothetical protein